MPLGETLMRKGRTVPVGLIASREAPVGKLDLRKFVQDTNIVHFIDLLKIETDPAKRKVLQELLREEKAGLLCHIEAATEHKEVA
jgi:hypothetical protein